MRKVLRLALWAAGGGLLLASAGAGVRATATAPYYTDYQTAAAGVINTAAAIHHKLGAATDSETPACRAAWLAAIQKLASLNTSSSTGDVDAFVLSADSYTTLAVNELGVDIAGTDRNDNYDLVVEFFELADRIDDAKPGLTTSATADTIYGNIIEEFKEGRGGAIGATDYLRYIRAAKLALAQGGIDFTDGAYYDDYQSAAAGMMHTAVSVQNNVTTGGTESQESKDVWNLAIGKLASLDENSTQADVDAFVAAANAYRSIALDDGIDPDYKGASYDAATEFFEYADKLDDAKPGLTTTAAADVLYGAIIDKMVAGQGDTVGATDYKDYVRAAKLALAQGGIDFVDEAYYNDYQSAAAGVIHTATAIHGTSGVTESQESKGAWNLALGKLAALDGNSTTADVDAFIAAANAYRDIALGDGIDPDYKGSSYDAVVEFFRLANIMDENRNSGANLDGDADYEAANDVYGALIGRFVAGDGPNVGADDYLEYIRDAKYALAKNGVKFLASDYYNDYQSAAAGMMHTAAAVENNVANGGTESQVSKDAWNLALGKLASLDENSTQADVDAFVAAANAYRSIALDDGVDPDYKGSSYEAATEFFEYADKLDDAKHDSPEKLADLADEVAAADAIYGEIINKMLAGEGAEVNETHYKDYVEAVKAVLLKAGLITPEPTPSPTPAPVQQSSSNGGDNASHGGGDPAATTPAKAPSCDAPRPVGMPDLFQIDRKGSDAVLWFTPVRDYTNQYHVVFGHQDGEEKYGGIALHVNDEQNNGVQSITIHDLDPNKQYSFQVMAVNSCAVGDRSNWLSAKPVAKKSNVFTKTFRYLGK